MTSLESTKNAQAKYRIQNLKERFPGSYLIEYYEMTIDGDIVIGQELLKQLENLLDDLDNPEYIFDRSDADFRIDFIERFCKHTKSPFYGMPFLLELWEKALIEAFYSFKWTDTGLRRFKKLILLIARKNGKSTISAAIALTEFMIGGGGVDVVCSSNDDAQADIIFQEIDNMRERFDPKDKRTRKNLKGIFNKKNKSTIKKLSDRTRNKEGRNIDVGILDEVHEMKTNTIGKSIEQSQSTKDEPIMILITTEGFVMDGYLDDELKYARQVLSGDIEDQTLLVWLYTQDSENEIWQDENSWQKSNPSLGLIKKPKFLKDQLKKAKHIKAERMFTLAKDFNIKQNNAQAWLLESEYTNTSTFNIDDLRGAVGIGGVDLSETTDLTCAKVMVMRPGSQTKYIITKYFIPEAKIEAGEIEDKKNYLEWARQGLVEVTPGNENDFAKITAWFVELYKTFGIKIYKVGYDNALAKFWVTEMSDKGFDMERVNMEKKILSQPMKLVEADLKSGLINYNNNPIDRWCLGNTAIKIDGIGLIMPIKVNDTKNRRIDGALAQIICHAVYTRFRTEYLSYVR
jgi:phage terminase large subunit-like protein